jgi:hypothetical protein
MQLKQQAAVSFGSACRNGHVLDFDIMTDNRNTLNILSKNEP